MMRVLEIAVWFAGFIIILIVWTLLVGCVGRSDPTRQRMDGGTEPNTPPNEIEMV
jgi:hypothetical protein